MNDCPDNWIDDVRIKMAEEMSGVGLEEYHKQMDKRINPIVEKYGLSIVDRIASTYISDTPKQILAVQSEL